MFENLQIFQKRYEELGQKLCLPEIAGDQTKFAALM